MESSEAPMDRAMRYGSSEGTGFGFLAAGSILGMAWLGEAFGSPVPLNEGAYAAAFLAAGAAIIAVAIARRRNEA